MGWDWSPGGEEESTLRCCLNLVFNIHSFHLLISNTSPLIGLNQEAKAINMKNGKKFRPNNFLKIDHTPSPKSPLPIFTMWGLMAQANLRSFRNQVQGWDHLNLWFLGRNLDSIQIIFTHRFFLRMSSLMAHVSSKENFGQKKILAKRKFSSSHYVLPYRSNIINT